MFNKKNSYMMIIIDRSMWIKMNWCEECSVQHAPMAYIFVSIVYKFVALILNRLIDQSIFLLSLFSSSCFLGFFCLANLKMNCFCSWRSINLSYQFYVWLWQISVQKLREIFIHLGFFYWLVLSFMYMCVFQRCSM